MLAEVVTIELGGAIATSILKFWLKNIPFGDDVSSSIIDILKSKTSDVLAQRRGARQFEVMGEQIGESLLPLFQSEGARLDKGDCIAVAYAVTETLKKAKISSKLLAQHNLEPIQLSEYMLATNPKTTRDFSEGASELYKRIVKESCVNIVDIASQLPSFTEQSFAEVLRREDQILAITRETLETLRKMREQLDPMVEAERFEIDYRQAVARNLDVLQLIGADVSLPNRRHRLSIAYIMLSVIQQLPSLLSPTLSSTEEPIRDVVSVDTALAASRRLLIKGFAGSGKTTLLQWIAVRAATKSFEGQLSCWNGHIPFYIRLRQYGPSRWPRPEAFPEFAAPAILGTMPERWVHHILKAGRAIVLVDGVDEVPTSQREEVHTWLRDLVETYKDSSFIVTSRPHAIEDGWMNNEAFCDALLQEMELADIFSFVDHWHEAVRQELHNDQDKIELDPLAENLKEVVRTTRSIHNLATNPLLCAMLCALNRERRRQLPANRIELYHACCSLLLERREKESRIDQSDYPHLNSGQKHRLLEDLAYWMIQENLSEADIQDVNERFTEQLAQMPNISQEITSRGVCKLFIERAGIIREPIAGQIDFTHRTFEEFFAAQAAINAGDIETLVANAHNDQWGEMIILASGLASKPICEQLIHGLIERGDTERDHRYQIHLLAVSCLETIIQLGPEVRKEVEKRLGQLVPPKNMTEAKAIAGAGELAVKYLGKKQKYTATISVACIRALSLIGGDTAFGIIEGYANDERGTVLTELLKAWDTFDRDIYAQRILSKKTTLKLESQTRLDGIQHLMSLTKLSLYYWSQLSDVSPLAALTNLTTLHLSGCSQLSDVSPLAALTNLTMLDLSGCHQLSDVSPLAALTNLTMLHLSGCHQLSDVSPLAALTNLTTLDLSNCSQLSDVSPLAGLTNLTTLDLYGCSQLSDVSPYLARLTNLTTLSLSNCSQLSDVSPRLTNLTTLSLSGCSQLSDVSPLAGLANLTTLDLYDCSQLSDVSPLAKLANLTTLSLSGCSQLSDVSPLARLTNLTMLSLSGCSQLSDVSPLARLTNLTRLYLGNCSQLSDVSPLAGLTNLTRLYLRGCSQLSDVSPLKGFGRNVVILESL